MAACAVRNLDVLVAMRAEGGPNAAVNWLKTGTLQTRQWDDDLGRRHWKSEVVASAVEMLSGRGRGAMREAVPVAPDLPAGATS